LVRFALSSLDAQYLPRAGSDSVEDMFALINRGQGLHFQMRPHGIHIWVPDHIVDLGCAVFQR
jgi:hypothetical protein